MTDTATIHTDISWTQPAWDLYGTWRDRCYAIAAHYGTAVGDRARSSLFHCINQLLACGPAEISTEGEMLYVVTAHIHFGIVWHGDTDPEFRAVTGQEPRDRAAGGWPNTGTWSSHS